MTRLVIRRSTDEALLGVIYGVDGTRKMQEAKVSLNVMFTTHDIRVFYTHRDGHKVNAKLVALTEDAEVPR
jgi:hypothetical protein